MCVCVCLCFCFVRGADNNLAVGLYTHVKAKIMLTAACFCMVKQAASGVDEGTKLQMDWPIVTDASAGTPGRHPIAGFIKVMGNAGKQPLCQHRKTWTLMKPACHVICCAFHTGGHTSITDNKRFGPKHVPVTNKEDLWVEVHIPRTHPHPKFGTCEPATIL